MRDALRWFCPMEKEQPSSQGQPPFQDRPPPIGEPWLGRTLALGGPWEGEFKGTKLEVIEAPVYGDREVDPWGGESLGPAILTTFVYRRTTVTCGGQQFSFLLPDGEPPTAVQVMIRLAQAANRLHQVRDWLHRNEIEMSRRAGRELRRILDE